MPERLAEVDLSVLVQLDDNWGRVWISDDEDEEATWLLIVEGPLYCAADVNGQPLRFNEYEAMIEMLQQAIARLAQAVVPHRNSES